MSPAALEFLRVRLPRLRNIVWYGLPGIAVGSLSSLCSDSPSWQRTLATAGLTALSLLITVLCGVLGYMLMFRYRWRALLRRERGERVGWLCTLERVSYLILCDNRTGLPIRAVKPGFQDDVYAYRAHSYAVGHCYVTGDLQTVVLLPGQRRGGRWSPALPDLSFYRKKPAPAPRYGVDGPPV